MPYAPFSADSPELTAPFHHLRGADTARAGGKGASLGELTAAGAPVPAGFVLLTRAWRQVLATTSLGATLDGLLAGLRADNLREVAARARDAITGLTLPGEIRDALQTGAAGLTRLAVRSSATAEDGSSRAWAGQLDTFLDVTAADLEARVLDCWASLFSERALVYRLQELGRPIEVAVVVQQMVAAEVAGVGFSVHPTTQEADLMLIQAAFGLGEAVVSGAVSPDTWVVSKSHGTLVEQALGLKSKALFPGTDGWTALGERGAEPSLSEAQVLRYAGILHGIETHYGRPMDTEWAWADGQFYVVQARPITTLDPGYDTEFYARDREWKPNVRRPWNLLSASLFCRNLQHTAAAFGLPPLPVLVLSLGPRMAQVCLVPADEARLREQAVHLCEHEPARVEAWLRRGLEWARQVADEPRFESLEAMLDACADAVTCGTQLPFQMLQGGIVDGPLGELAAANRQLSTYPYFMGQLLPRLAQELLAGLELRHPFDVVTVAELLAGPDPQVLRERDARVEAGERFVLQQADGAETVTFHPDNAFLLARFNGARVPRSGADEHRLHGAAAYPGLVEGTARIVLDPADPHPAFAEGDILVSVNANPSLMGFLSRCSALVTDEGGAACHAAILARELKKPCVMATGDATTRIREGQRVRVDAYAQVVELL